MGKHLDYKQESLEDTLDRAKTECLFTEKLYDILLAHQTGQSVRGQRPKGIPLGNVGELNPENSRLYNLIWAEAIGLNEKAKSKKQQSKQVGVIA